MERVLVFGLGKSGHALLDFFKGKVELSVYDDKAPDLVDLSSRYGIPINAYDPNIIYDLVALSPGPSPDHPVLQSCRARGMRLEGELEIAFSHLKGDVLAISGTNGKSTTTTLLHELIASEHERCFIGGNIGIPLLSYAQESRQKDVYVVEVSSFQLDSIRHFSPKISALLNITPDHLIWHGSMEAYVRCKFRLWENNLQQQQKVYNMDDGFLIEQMEKLYGDLEGFYGFSRLHEPKRGCFLRHGKIILKIGDSEEEILGIDELSLKGDHNVSNVLAAVLMAGLYGISSKSMAKVLRDFQGLAHRYELLGEKMGRRFINDSKATNIDSSLPALASAGRPTVLIAGGLDKKVPLEPLFEHWNPQIKYMLVFGEVKEQLAALGKNYTQVEVRQNLEDSFTRAIELSQEGWDILLSPACASWDMYKSFEERGDHFRRLFRSLQ